MGVYNQFSQKEKKFHPKRNSCAPNDGAYNLNQKATQLNLQLLANSISDKLITFIHSLKLWDEQPTL